MILKGNSNNASGIYWGSQSMDRVYYGNHLVWWKEQPGPEPPGPEPPGPEPPGPTPEPDWDKYEAEHGDKITVVLLDENGEETDDITYHDSLSNALNYLYLRNKDNKDDLFNVYYGNSVSVPSSTLWESYFMINFFNGRDVDRQNIKMFRYPAVWPYNNYVFKISNFVGVELPYHNLTKLKTVVLPYQMQNGYSITLPGNFATGSGIDKVVFRTNFIDGSKYINMINNGGAFANCTYLKEIELPQFSGKYGLGTGTFSGCDGIKIILHNEENELSNSPWGATNAEIIWKGKYN